MTGLIDTTGGLYVLILLFLVILAALWILLPFAVFGARKQLKEQTGLLRDMRAELLKAKMLLRQCGDDLDRILVPPSRCTRPRPTDPERSPGRSRNLQRPC